MESRERSTPRASGKVGTSCESRGGAGPFVVTSTWVLGGSSQKSLSRSLARDGQAIFDCCGFDGRAVVGAYTLERMRESPAMSDRISAETARTVPELYRFGGGTALAWRTADIEVMLGDHRKTLAVDVVPGVLPMLLGREFGRENRLVADTETGQVFRKVGRNRQDLVASNSGSGLMLVSLCGRVYVGESGTGTAMFGANVSDEESTGEESDSPNRESRARTRRRRKKAKRAHSRSEQQPAVASVEPEPREAPRADAVTQQQQ